MTHALIMIARSTLIMLGVALYHIGVAQQNTYLGYKTGDSNVSGLSNVMVGAQAGEMNTGSGNIFIGAKAGQNESGDNKLVISNTNGGATIYGELDNNRIGIATTTLPADTTFKLAVNGKMICTEVKVTQTANWPDYVFFPDHNLMSINNLEAYIKLNGHLPGIPSSEEVGNTGVELGEMQIRLLEKIEELTLYIIQQNQQMLALQQEIDSLKSEKK